MLSKDDWKLLNLELLMWLSQYIINRHGSVNDMPDASPASSTLLVPLIALIVALSVNSVRDRDSMEYRIFVGGLGTLAFVPIFSSLVFEATGLFADRPSFTDSIYAALSFILVLVLVTGTMFKEVARGLNGRDRDVLKKRYFWLFIAGLAVMVVLMILIQLVIT
jgi:hypothetical protein